MTTKTIVSWAATIILVIIVISAGLRLRRMYVAIDEIEACGGLIVECKPVWMPNPTYVTFRVPGSRRPLKDSDSLMLRNSFAMFSNIRTIDFMETNISDEFIRNVARRGLAKKINISDTRCTEESVRILAKTQSCELVRVHCLDMSLDTRMLAISQDVEIAKLEAWATEAGCK